MFRRFDRYGPRDVKVRLGEYDFAARKGGRAADFAVSEIRVHRGFDPTTYENDVAILKTRRPTLFRDHVWPVCLPPVDRTFEREHAIVTGS